MAPAARVNRRAFPRAISLVVSLSLVGVAALAPPVARAEGETIEIGIADTDVTFTYVEYSGTGTPETTAPVRIRAAETCEGTTAPEAELPDSAVMDVDSGGSGFGSVATESPIQPGWFVVAVMLDAEGTTTLATSACFEVTGSLTPPIPAPQLAGVHILEPQRTTVSVDYSLEEGDTLCQTGLDDTQVPDPGDYAVATNGVATPVSTVALFPAVGCPTSVRLHLGAALPTGVVSVIYTPGATPLRNNLGEPAEAFEIGAGEVLERASADLAPGASIGTDGEGDGAHATDPIETIVTASGSGLGGSVTIGERHTGGLAGSIPGLTMLSLQSFIVADAGTITEPLEIEFIVDSGQLADLNGQPFDASELEVLAHGDPVQPCSSGSSADPEPCEVARTHEADGVHITVRSAASERIWTFGYDLAPQMFAVETPHVETLDHVILLFLEELDAASLPSPDDFTVLVDGVPQDTTRLRILANGLTGLGGAVGIPGGFAFLELEWADPITTFNEITVDYLPGADPLRDVRGNEVPAATLTMELVSVDFVVGVMEDAIGPNHLLLFLPGSLSTVPAASDFEVVVDGVATTPTDVVRRFPDLGITLLDLTLADPVAPFSGVTASYIGATPLSYVDGSAAPASFDFVDTSGLGTNAGATEPGIEGEPVVVTPRDASTLAATTTITFPEVTGGGLTTVASGIETTAPQPIPANFSLGDPPLFYEIATTASFIGPAEVCVAYNPASFTDEAQVRMLHFEGGAWADVTSSLDQAANRVCGLVASFSPFAVVEASSSVTYEFSGFFAPVDNLPTVNEVNSGRAIPVTFGLGGDRGLEIFADGSPSSLRVACPGAAPLDTIETTLPATANGLSYDPASDRYTYVWKTSKAWAGTCRMLSLSFADGTTEEAIFRFTN